MYAVQLWLKNENEVLTRCETIYASEKGTVTKEELKAANPDYGFIDEVQEEYPEFDSIRAEIMSMLNDVRNILLDDNKSLQYGKGVHICVDNCKANKEAEEGTTLRIVYPTDEQMATMEKDPVFLVIGGNTLARGLTIDGLVCSYFSRNSNQADTLMQMARWFGYRKGFELMQRIWMTESVLKKFEASATGMVKNMLDALISDSPNSAFERATLPKYIIVYRSALPLKDQLCVLKVWMLF